MFCNFERKLPVVAVLELLTGLVAVTECLFFPLRYDSCFALLRSPTVKTNIPLGINSIIDFKEKHRDGGFTNVNV